jgi:peptidoglycan/xylan/chitin deacetylase (PgdA/CDA1 family)
MVETTGTIPSATSASARAAAARVAAPACVNPNALGISRVVEIDTTGGPGFGFQHFKSYDFLNDHEVVLTFDDGPWLGHTAAVLKALADQCLRATFFSIGKHATYYPEILKQVAAAGHTVGSHTWSHADLQAVIKKSGPDAAKEEIEKGASAVRMMAGAPIAPFFRFPDLRHPPEMLTYLGERDIASFSTDIDSWDFKIKKPEELIKSLMAKLQKAGKGIILMHDFQKVTSIALPQILAQLQTNGFKVVHMVPKGALTTLPKYDEAVLKENKLPTMSSRPTDSVVRTISDLLEGQAR